MVHVSLWYKLKKEREKEISESHQNSDDNIIDIIRKILMIWIQENQEMSSTVTGVGLTSFSKISKPLMLFLDGLCNLLWSSLVIFFGVLNSFCQDLSNYTNSVVIEVSLCFQDLSLSLSSLFTNYNKKGWEMRKKQIKKRFWKHTETPMTTSSIS